jgi:hypothetical protein
MEGIVGTMTAFVVELHHRIVTAGQALNQAVQAEDDRMVHQHSARLLDLLDRAAATDVDTSGWVPAGVVAAAAGNCA